MKQIVAITITGLTNTGKTSIAYKIKEVLDIYGINTIVNDFDEGVPEIEKCLVAVSKKTDVVITVNQAMRGFR